MSESKRLITVFTTIFTAKQGDGRAECIEAKGDDYATGAEWRLFSTFGIKYIRSAIGVALLYFSYLFAAKS